eukprot:GCRY01003841.1.p1 GENE.GCRY01003841.1~~GCRY01003841.1.p1  ORF type:complete len:811 (-),score=244.85 GCRY01003841.1:755-3187(-)
MDKEDKKEKKSKAKRKEATALKDVKPTKSKTKKKKKFNLKKTEETSKVLSETSSKDPTVIFDITEILGRGAAGVVYKGQLKSTGKEVAVKKIRVKSSNVEAIIKEIETMKQLRSPYIVQYYGAYAKEKDLWLSMEFCDSGSIGDLIKSKPLTEKEIAVIVLQILRSLDYLHSVDLVHRDVKAANVLLTKKGRAKLADFGITGGATDGVDGEGGGTESLMESMGSPYWMAPEVIANEPYDCNADIWSLGVTIIELAQQAPPYYHENAMRAVYRIVNEPAPKLASPRSYSPELNDFVSRCLVKDPSLRATAHDLLQHPFVQQALAGGTHILQQLCQDFAQLKKTPQSEVVGKTATEGEEEKEGILRVHTGPTTFRTVLVTSKTPASQVLKKMMLKVDTSATPDLVFALYEADLTGVERPLSETDIPLLWEERWPDLSWDNRIRLVFKSTAAHTFGNIVGRRPATPSPEDPASLISPLKMLGHSSSSLVSSGDGEEEDEPDLLEYSRVSALLELLASDPTLGQAIADTKLSVSEQTALMRALAVVYTHGQSIVSLFSLVAESEIARASSEDQKRLFRSGEGLTTRLLSAYAKVSASQYLRQCLGPIIQEVVSDPSNLEIDPNHVAPGEKPASAVPKLQALADRFLTAILTSVSYMPLNLRLLIHEASTLLTKYLGAPAPQQLSTLLFMRFYCPVISIPWSLDILSGPPQSRQARRAFLHISKIFQNMATRTTFSPDIIKDIYLTDFNPYIAEHTDDIAHFVEATAAVPSNMEEVPEGDNISETDLYSALSTILELSRSHLTEIEVAIDSLPEA